MPSRSYCYCSKITSRKKYFFFLLCLAPHIQTLFLFNIFILYIFGLMFDVKHTVVHLFAFICILYIPFMFFSSLARSFFFWVLFLLRVYSFYFFTCLPSILIFRSLEFLPWASFSSFSCPHHISRFFSLHLLHSCHLSLLVAQNLLFLLSSSFLWFILFTLHARIFHRTPSNLMFQKKNACVVSMHTLFELLFSLRAR